MTSDKIPVTTTDGQAKAVAQHAMTDAVLQALVSTEGRIGRIVAGLLLVIGGPLGLGGTTGWAIAGVGLIPIAARAFDFCLLGPVFGYSFRGPEIRRQLRANRGTIDDEG